MGPEAGDDQETELLEALETSADDEQRARHEAQRDHWFDMIRAELGSTTFAGVCAGAPAGDVEK